MHTRFFSVGSLLAGTVLAVIAAAVPAALAILGILAGVCYLIGAVLWFRSRPKKPKPPERSTGPQPQSIAFVDVLDRQDAALYTKIPAVMVGDLNARRMQRARIRARSTLVDEFRREPSAAELAAAAQFLFDLNGTEIKVSEEEIRSYFDAGGTISPELRPWNEEARKDDPAAIHQGGSVVHTDTAAPMSDARFVRGCTHYIFVGKQINEQIRMAPSDIEDAGWSELNKRVHDYLNDVLLFLNEHRPKYWFRLAELLAEPTHLAQLVDVPIRDADGNEAGTAIWGYGDRLRERIDRVAQILRAAVDGS